VGEYFYEPLGDGRYAATEHTVGPWSPTDQHAGPPSALLVREVERLADGDGFLARIAVDVLGPVPVGEVEVRAEVVRDGRAVRLYAAELRADGRVAMRATVWRHQRSDTSAVALPAPPGPARPPSEAPRADFPAGYLHAIEWGWAKGHFSTPGPATVWARQRPRLVGDEEPSPMQRLMVIADSGNGASQVLDPRRWLFVNTDLTVHVDREPVGEWICLEAETSIGEHGSARAHSRLYDERGEVGRGAQALLVRPR
jgi:hypothetical protein